MGIDMYQLNNRTGIVTIKATGQQVAPAQSFNDPDFLDYKNWVMLGHAIEIIDEPENVKEIIIVDKASFKIALSRLGLLETVLYLVNNADIEIQILFNDKTEFHSNNTILNNFAAANNMSVELQQVFTLARQIMQELR